MTDKIVAIDFETANYNADSAISMGLVVIENHTITQISSWLIRPPRMSFTPSFIDIHGITPEDVRHERNFGEIWPDVEPYLRGAVMLAHNAAFDRRVLESTAAHYDIMLPPMEWICTVALSRKNWPELSRHKLNVVCQHLDIPLNHHDATSDALGAAKIYLASHGIRGSEIKTAV